jgi:hypothetical protein
VIAKSIEQVPARQPWSWQDSNVATFLADGALAPLHELHLRRVARRRSFTQNIG